MKSKILCFLILLPALTALPKAPSPQAPSFRFQLANGIPVILVPHHRPGNTVLNLFIRGGQRLNPPDRPGLAYLTTRLLNELHSTEQIRELRELGGRFRLNSFGEYSLLSAVMLSQNLSATLEIFATIVKNPIFSGTRLDFIRGNTRSLLTRLMDDPRQQITQIFREALGPPAVLGHPVLGTAEGLDRIRLRDLRTLYRRCFTAGNLLITVCTDLPVSRIRGALHRAFADISPGPPATLAPLPAPVPFTGDSRLIPRELEQTYIALGFQLGPLTADRYLQAHLLSTHLGQGIGSALWPLRSRYHLTYSIRSEVLAFSHGGVLIVTVAAAPDQAAEARCRLRELIDDLRQQGLTEEEYRGCRDYLRLQLLIGGEEKIDRAYTAGRHELLGLGADFTDAVPRRAAGISRENFHTFLRALLAPANRLEVIAGTALPPCQPAGE